MIKNEVKSVIKNAAKSTKEGTIAETQAQIYLKTALLVP